MREKLTNKNISKACDEAGAFLTDHGCDSKEVLRITFSMEEVLLNYQKLFGTEAEFVMDTGSGLGRSKIRITVPGKEADPYADSDSFSDEAAFIRNALNQMGKLPRWKYKRGTNEVLFTTEKKRLPDWMKLIIAIAAAVICGFAIRLLPESAAIIIRDGIVAPLISTFLGFLNAVAGPMIFFAVVWGIYSIGDAATFSEVGKRLSRNTGIFLVFMTSAVALITLPFFKLNYSGGKAGGDFSSLYQMVLDIIPSNLFTPFSRGNTLQILFVAVVVGVAMLLIGKNTQAVADLSEQLGFIVNGIMNVISSLVPAFVFGSFFTILASSDFSQLASGGKFFLSSVIGCALLLVLHTIATCLICRINPAKLWKATLPTFIIAVTTASSSAAFAENLNTCINKLDVNKRLANFVRSIIE
jgi:Na+/H+-dicarboxylate symporter